MNNKSSISKRLITMVNSRGFFGFIIILFLIESLWIALSSKYPMAFDENFHFGIIKLYSVHLSPFWSGQPAHADTFGAVARDPSYLYQYLMSFPYRIIRLFTNDQNIQVVLLRFINIGIFSLALVLFRRLILKLGTSSAVANICLLVFILIPVVPFLAAQINYDNLLILAVPSVLLLVNSFAQTLNTKKKIDVKLLYLITMLCLLTTLVKYAFLPIFAAVVVYIYVISYQALKTHTKLLKGTKIGFANLGKTNALILSVGLVICFGMFFERFGLNLIHYHSPVPDCSKVLTTKQCSSYGPWIRDYNYKINKLDEEHNPVVYLGDWFYGMWLRLFFTVSGPPAYETKGPFIVPADSAIVFFVSSIVVLAIYWRKILKKYNHHLIWLLVITAATYVLVIFADNYKAYIHTGQPVAINGRYLLPVLIPIIGVVALAYNELLKNHDKLKLLLAGVVILSLAWGGGSLTYALRSNDSWYWQSQPVFDANHAIQTVVGPLTPGYYMQNQFLR